MTPSKLEGAAARLTRELRMNGPCLSSELRARCGLGTPSFTRALATLRPSLLAVGATRSLTLALRRTIPGLPRTLPVYELMPEGTRLFGTLHPVEPRGFYIESGLEVRGFYPDLPWFFHDLRPSGFLGRLAPRQHPELGLPPDILLWSADHVLRWLHEWGVDNAGDFVVGDPAFGRVQHQELASRVLEHERVTRYPEIARAVLGLGVPGSSAAGEQPKFLATRVASPGAAVPVLVKFSPAVVDAGSRRTADLLRCERHALAVLREAGIPAAAAEIVEADGRVFLEVQRFDRRGGGRVGVVSLLAAAANEGCDLGSWSHAADELLDRRVVTRGDQERVYWLDRFGALIGNTDRHAGNLSFFFADGALGGVAPVYDMLPMRYAVRNGEFRTPVLDPPTPTPRYASGWRQVWSAAEAFWALVAGDEAMDADLRQVAAENRQRLVDRRPELARLPADAQLGLFPPR